MARRSWQLSTGTRAPSILARAVFLCLLPQGLFTLLPPDLTGIVPEHGNSSTVKNTGLDTESESTDMTLRGDGFDENTTLDEELSGHHKEEEEEEEEANNSTFLPEGLHGIPGIVFPEDKGESGGSKHHTGLFIPGLQENEDLPDTEGTNDRSSFVLDGVGGHGAGGHGVGGHGVGGHGVGGHGTGGHGAGGNGSGGGEAEGHGQSPSSGSGWRYDDWLISSEEVSLFPHTPAVSAAPPPEAVDVGECGLGTEFSCVGRCVTFRETPCSCHAQCLLYGT
ncbi:hypothetical protein ACOMHN_041443 [Nucella lapillus]